MKAATINEIKKELQEIDSDILPGLCLRLAKYKLENKELLTYLLFEAHDEQAYISNVKADVEEMFTTLPEKNVYLIKKVVRKILRFMNKQIKYSGITETELELRIFFCSQVREHKVPLQHGTVLYNMYQQQLKKIFTSNEKLEEDLQADYEESINRIQL